MDRDAAAEGQWKQAGLTPEEIDEVLALLEDTGPPRDTLLRSLARLLTRLGHPRPPVRTPRTGSGDEPGSG